MTKEPQERRRQVLVVGAGFGGLAAARGFRRADLDVTVVDRNNHHLFSPLLYQVATAGLSPADIASPIRTLVKRQRNTRVLMDEVTGIDPRARTATLAGTGLLAYDILILALGSLYHYFGQPQWAARAPSLKTIEDATRIRAQVLSAFERAEIETDAERQRQALTFVIVGGGPTGVELAGAISELARRALAADFRRIRPALAHVVLLEAGPRILAAFPAALSRHAEHDLERLGVEVRTSAKVERIEASAVVVNGAALPADTILWAAGVRSALPSAWLGRPGDEQGRVRVERDLSVPGFPEIYVIGDAAAVPGPDGKPLPGVAPVAMQEGRYVARAVLQKLRGATPPPFRYRDRGNLATIGRSKAVADFGRLQLHGFPAWLVWSVVHIFYLIGFQNRLLVFIQWAWAYVTFQRGARLITKS